MKIRREIKIIGEDSLLGSFLYLSVGVDSRGKRKEYLEFDGSLNVLLPVCGKKRLLKIVQLFENYPNHQKFTFISSNAFKYFVLSCRKPFMKKRSKQDTVVVSADIFGFIFAGGASGVFKIEQIKAFGQKLAEYVKTHY